MTTPIAALEVEFLRPDRTPAVATRWSKAPVLPRFKDCQWLYDETEGCFVLVARPRRTDEPLAELVRVRPSESLGFDDNGNPIAVPYLTHHSAA